MKKIWMCVLLIMPVYLSVFANKAYPVTNADYAAAPPFIGAVNQPNVMIVLDNSGSMNEGAYTGSYNPAQFTSGQYYGYFDPAKNYQYTGTKWEVTTLAMTSGTVANPIATGNFLNWATMRRIDIAKKLLVGGNTDPKSPAPGMAVKLLGEPSSTSWDFNKDYDNTAMTQLYPFGLNYRFSMSQDKLSIVPVSTNPGDIRPSSQIFKDEVENGVGGWTTTGLWHRETGPNCLQTHGGLASWYYGQYVSTATPSCNFNKTVTSGAILLAFDGPGSKIKRSSGSFITDGFSSGMTIWTTSTTNPGPFTIISVISDEINVSGVVITESVTATITSNTSVINSGTLTSKSISLAAGSAPQLSFWYYYQTESSGTVFDQRWVQISTDGGTTWANLTQLSGDTMSTWIQKSIDLTAYAGQTIKLRFYFNTVDAILNNSTGWYIDDVLITGNTASCGISVPAAWSVTGAATVCDAVDESASDGDTTYIQNTTTTDPVIFNYNYYNVPDFSGATITNIAVKVEAKRLGGSGTTRKLNGALRVNGTDYFSAASSSLGSSYSTYTFTWAQNPATSAAWTWNDIKSGGIGSIGGFGVKNNSTSATIYPRITQVYMVITVSLPSGGPFNTIVEMGNVPVEGIIQNLSSGARFGLAYYNTDSQGGKIDTDIDFGSPTNMVTSIRNKTATTMTPLSETLYEVIRYYRQDAPYYAHSPADYQTGLNYDPFYFRFSAANQVYVPCAKSFVLFLTDGEPTSDTNIPASIQGYAAANGGYGTGYFADMALWMRQQPDASSVKTGDIRTGTCTSVPTSFQQCIPESQSLVLYPVFLFGRGSSLLKNAAINGGFDDLDQDLIPDCSTTPKECYRDSNGDGVVSSDGSDFPITYFEGDDGYELQGSITNALSDIMKRGASGTSVSILATSAEGEGGLYQAYFYPNKILSDGTKRDWLGYCRGLFVDAEGNLREDTDQDANLVYKDDNILRMRLDTITNLVYGDLYKDVSPEDGKADSATRDSTAYVDDLKALWEAGKDLATKDKAQRNIYAWVDRDNDGIVDDGDFSAATPTEALSFSTTNSAILQASLRAADSTEADNIIKFIRGTPVSGYRNRCIPVTGETQETGCSASTERVWGLGDVIYSTPTVVSGTREQYDQLYGSDALTYVAFRNRYNSRRQVVYVGANDGMLHAFNAGVYLSGDDTATGDTEHGTFLANPTSGNGWTSPAAPALGEELWSFIPYDNLPHLKWLTSQSYSHVYYVDLKPKPTDVRIFCDTDTTLNPPTGANCTDGQAGASHPGGWGTILIVGMRLGGGAIGVDLNGDGDTVDAGETLRSSYYVLDVTDPERPPKLLWRFKDDNLGFTTSYPAIAHIKGTPEKWFMVVGSGPDNNVPTGSRGYEGTSTQTGRVFVVNLLNGTLAKTFTTDANAFMGDPTIVDGDLDFTTDVVYIGSVNSTTSGKVYRINTNSDLNPANWTLSTFIDAGRPLLVGPSVSKDSFNNLWVFFGTGRLFGVADKTNGDQQSLWGIKDGCWKGGGTVRLASVSAGNVVTAGTTDTACPVTYTTGRLLDVTNTQVTVATGASQVSGLTASASSYQTLLSTARSAHGWYSKLSSSAPTEKVLSRSVVIGGLVLFTTFTPTTNICGFQGDSSIYALYYETGTAYIKPVIGTTGSGASEIISKSKTLGKGMPTTVGIAVGKKTKGYVQTSTGTIVEVEAQPPLGVRSGASGWREKTGGGGTVEIEEMYKHIVK